MTMLFSALMAMMLSELMFAPVPPTITPKNEVERLVLARPESASRELEERLAHLQDKDARNRAMIEAGFKRVRSNDACAAYVYTRQVSAKIVRGASVILCDDKRPFVLRTDETPGPWFAPKPGEPSPSVR